jgi:glutathione S-transferase
VIDRSDPREFLAGLNPTRRAPTIVLEDGRPLAESNAILCYFGEDSRFVPDDRYERGQMLQWLFFEQYAHEPAIAVARFLKTYSTRPDVYERRKDELLKRGYHALDAMEGWLAERPWFVGDTMTLADIALYAYTHAADEGGYDLERYPRVRGWLARVAAEPGHVPIDA